MINEVDVDTQNEERGKTKKEKPPHVVIKNTADYQRMKLEKLMKNPEKPVIIPERPKERGAPHIPDFVRNVMGSSAGAGSGEFHVYRHLRRKEYARQKYMEEKARREQLENEYKQKLEDNKRLAEEKTARKRTKRLKRKMKQKARGKKPKTETNKQQSSSEGSEESSPDEDSGTKEDNKSGNENCEGENTEKNEEGNKAPNEDVDENLAKTNEEPSSTGNGGIDNVDSSSVITCDAKSINVDGNISGKNEIFSTSENAEVKDEINNENN